MDGEDDSICLGLWTHGSIGLVGVCDAKVEVLRGVNVYGRLWNEMHGIAIVTKEIESRSGFL